MTYMFDIWRLLLRLNRRLSLNNSQSLRRDLARAAAKASSWNGFGCGRDVWLLQVLVRVWTTCAVACPGVRWHVKLRQEGATLRAFGAIAYNVPSVCVVKAANEMN
jgi:hypothetical protein